MEALAMSDDQQALNQLTPLVYKQLRRANVRRFPYGVFYQIKDKSIIVVAILHARRAPRHWKSRLE